jgi:hypothetical protein
MLDAAAIEIQFDPPDAVLTYRNYRETCRRAGVRLDGGVDRGAIGTPGAAAAIIKRRKRKPHLAGGVQSSG